VTQWKDLLYHFTVWGDRIVGVSGSGVGIFDMEKGELTEHFTDEETKNGFTYEIEEMLCCVREGRLESQIVPWKDTIECAKLFDRIGATFSS